MNLQEIARQAAEDTEHWKRKALSEIENHLTNDFLTRGTTTLPTPAKCSRCNNTGSWGGVDGHLYPSRIK
jgi:TRAP-type C4-dicarboxylate transport system substrate-binding protein